MGDNTHTFLVPRTHSSTTAAAQMKDEYITCIIRVPHVYHPSTGIIAAVIFFLYALRQHVLYNRLSLDEGSKHIIALLL